MGLHLGIGDFALCILESDFAGEGMVMSTFQKMIQILKPKLLLMCFLLTGAVVCFFRLAYAQQYFFSIHLSDQFSQYSGKNISK